jgi:hypothetical protein
VRVRKLNDAAVRKPAVYVLYWSQMNRRVESNHALEHAATLANQLDLPLLVYEGLTGNGEAFGRAGNRLRFLYTPPPV